MMKKEEYYSTKTQSIKLAPLKTNGFILDIGCGGEGVIGKLNGKQVVAIDTTKEELQGTCNEALKIVMDATDLKFLPNVFDICTSFFSLMYIPNEKHFKVFNEIFKTLKDNGKFLVWDVKIPEKHNDYKGFLVNLKIQLPNEEIKTGYGVKWDKQQDIEYFKELARKTRFKIISEWSNNVIFFLEMLKSA